MSDPTLVFSGAPWPAAAQLVGSWLEHRERIDALLDNLPAKFKGAERARCQHLVLGVVRHFGRLDLALGPLLAKRPRMITSAILYVAGFELIDALGDRDDTRPAKIVHHAVEQAKSLASPAEARLINAVVRKLAGILAAQPIPGATAPAEELAAYFSHPEWLVRRWLAAFGAESTHALLSWNQQPAPVYARWRAAEPVPSFLRPTTWPNFYSVAPGHWPDVDPLLKAGSLYLQDPSTRIPVEQLAPREHETIADLCAAPGGKALQIADAMKTGRLIAADLPTARLDRLKENLGRAGAVDVALVQADVLKQFWLALREHKLPEEYDGVMLDVPCSNTGVMRHRVDVKWRLQAGDFKKHPQQQLSMLHESARLVQVGGRLVYSTCSIDTAENEDVVRSFLASRAGNGWTLAASVLSFPWKDGHDGGAAFLLKKSG